MISRKEWVLQIDPAVLRTLKKISRSDGERILITLEQMADDPFAGDVQKMKGESSVWRRRIGSYRIFYELLAEKKILHIFRVERRTSNTY